MTTDSFASVYPMSANESSLNQTPRQDFRQVKGPLWQSLKFVIITPPVAGQGCDAD
jgi:hypothetical protein